MEQYTVYQELAIPARLTGCPISPDTLKYFDPDGMLTKKLSSLVLISLLAWASFDKWEVSFAVETGPDKLGFELVGMIRCAMPDPWGDPDKERDKCDGEQRAFELALQYIAETRLYIPHGRLLSLPAAEELHKAVILVEVVG